MKETIKMFFDKLDNMLEHDDDINVNSVDELVKKANETIKKEL